MLVSPPALRASYAGAAELTQRGDTVSARVARRDGNVHRVRVRPVRRELFGTGWGRRTGERPERRGEERGRGKTRLRHTKRWCKRCKPKVICQHVNTYPVLRTSQQANDEMIIINKLP